MRLYIVFLIFFISSLTIVTASEEFPKAILKRTMVEAVRDKVAKIQLENITNEQKADKVLTLKDLLPSAIEGQKKKKELALAKDLLHAFVFFLRNPEKEDTASSLVSEHIKKLQSELREAKNAIQANPTVTVLQEKEKYLESFYNEYMNYFILGDTGRELAMKVAEVYKALISEYKKKKKLAEAYRIYQQLSEKITDQIKAAKSYFQGNIEKIESVALKFRKIMKEEQEASDFGEMRNAFLEKEGEKEFIRKTSMSLFNHVLALQQALGNAKKVV